MSKPTPPPGAVSNSAADDQRERSGALEDTKTVADGAGQDAAYGKPNSAAMATQTGLAEQSAAFQASREGTGRFEQSVRLQRFFALIDDNEQRQAVIRLAEALALSTPSPPKTETN